MTTTRKHPSTLRRIGQYVGLTGWVLIGALAFGLVLGLIFGWIEFVVIAIIAAILMLMALPFLSGLQAYNVSFALENERVVAGQGFVGFAEIKNISNRSALPGSVDLPLGDALLEVEVPLLRAGVTHSESFEIPGLKRSVIRVGPASTIRSDPLKIFKRERTWGAPQTLYVHPQTAVLHPASFGFVRDLEGKASAQIVQDDLSFHAIREYEPGDSRKHVDWKSTAKTAKLMVRQYEATQRSQMLIFLATDFASYVDDDEFELAVSIAASLAMRGLRDGRDLNFFAGSESRRINSRSQQILLDECSGISLHDSKLSLKEETALVATVSGNASVVFIVCGSAKQLKEINRASLIFASYARVIAVIADPTRSPGLTRFGDITVLTVGILEDFRQLLARNL